MRKLLTLTIALLLTCSAAMAVPAKRGTATITQSDGTTITVSATGDEWTHSIVTTDGLTVERGDDGDFYYRNAGGATRVRAHNVGDRAAAEQAFLNANRAQLTIESLQEAATARRAAARRAAGPRRLGSSATVTSGSPRIPVLVVEFADKKLSNDISAFRGDYVAKVNKYFKDVSNGIYDPQFEIHGPYPLPSNRATYGGNYSGNDKGLGTMIYDACQLATDVDFSRYDNDNDGKVDVVIVLYAGVGEAQASYTVPSSVWPCFWNMTEAYQWNLSSSDAFTLNDKVIDNFAVFNEINGSNDNGTTLDGVGTFCHEFSHFLGLPDFYVTSSSNANRNNFGMDAWSLMHYGCYNNDGYTPVGYSAYEKNFMGWLDFITPVENTQYTLSALNQVNVETDKAVKIVNPNNSNECFILEHRKKQGWDSYIDDEGIMITHVNYVASRWEDNTVNNYSVQSMTIMHADNTATRYDMATDLYGETNHEFTDESTPAAVLNMRSGSSTPVSNAGLLGKPVTEITLNADGTASFWYVKSEPPVITATPATVEFSGTHPGEVETSEFTVTGSDLRGDITVTLTGDDAFSIDVESIAAASAEQGAPVTVTFAPAAAGSFSATVTLSSEGTDDVTVTLTGEAELVKEPPVIETPTPETVSTKSFMAVWNEVPNVESYTLQVVKQANGNGAPARAQETVSGNTLTVTGITETSYVVANLDPATTYNYRVKAVYTDGDESDWSNAQSVTTKVATGIGGITAQGNVSLAGNVLKGNAATRVYNAAGIELRGNNGVWTLTAGTYIVVDNGTATKIQVK